jgi:hypothetical protein
VAEQRATLRALPDPPRASSPPTYRSEVPHQGAPSSPPAACEILDHTTGGLCGYIRVTTLPGQPDSPRNCPNHGLHSESRRARVGRGARGRRPAPRAPRPRAKSGAPRPRAPMSAPAKVGEPAWTRLCWHRPDAAAGPACDSKACRAQSNTYHVRHFSLKYLPIASASLLSLTDIVMLC